MRRLVFIFVMVYSSSFMLTAQEQKQLLGKWIRMTQQGIISLELKEDGTAKVDFGNDESPEVVSEYTVEDGTITFNDKEGVACPEPGKYKMNASEYYLGLDLIADDCGGRIRATMGFWTRQNHEELIEELTGKLKESPKPKYYIKRARIFMATGNSAMAKKDLDQYIAQVPDDVRAYINRAGTRFPDDLEGIIADCNKAIELDQGNKNAYFLKGLALYDLGKEEEACNNFSTAIELGFSFLQIAEKEKCKEYW